MKQLPVVDINRGDGAVGIFQESLVADDVHYRKAVTRTVAVNAADDRSLPGIPFHLLHIEIPLFLRGDCLPLALVTVFFGYTRYTIWNFLITRLFSSRFLISGLQL
jgi:hypothetical protein